MIQGAPPTVEIWDRADTKDDDDKKKNLFI